MMKAMMTKTVASVLSLGVLTSLSCMAEEQKSDAGNKNNEAIMEALESALKDAKIGDATMESIRKAVQEAPRDAEPKVQNLTFRKTVVIGPDGKVRTIDGSGMEGIDLSKLMLMAEGDVDDTKSGDVRVEGRGSIKVIGPDGEVTKSDFDLGDSSDLNEIFKKTIEAINGQDGVTSVGPGILTTDDNLVDRLASAKQQLESSKEQIEKLRQQPAKPQVESINKELERLRQELVEQRKMLEKILSKVE
jgi:hypothetical protein